MHNRSDQFSKNILRDALSLASAPETEVEVLAASQKIDVYSVPDPARQAERVRMGPLGELSAEPSLFEPFRNTPSHHRVRRCLNKQLTWHHELERRAHVASGSTPVAAESEETSHDAAPFPALVIIGPGRPETVLDAYGCKPVRPGVYHAVWGLRMRVVVLAELPRTRETLLLRLLGSGRLLREALADLAALPGDAWERSVATPLLVHFRLGTDQPATREEDDMSAEIRAWFEEYEQKLRREERREGERTLLLRLLRARFGELSPAAVARVEAADVADIERWGERVLAAHTLADVLDGPSLSRLKVSRSRKWIHTGNRPAESDVERRYIDAVIAGDFVLARSLFEHLPYPNRTLPIDDALRQRIGVHTHLRYRASALDRILAWAGAEGIAGAWSIEQEGHVIACGFDDWLNTNKTKHDDARAVLLELGVSTR